MRTIRPSSAAWLTILLGHRGLYGVRWPCHSTSLWRGGLSGLGDQSAARRDRRRVDPARCPLQRPHEDPVARTQQREPVLAVGEQESAVGRVSDRYQAGAVAPLAG